MELASVWNVYENNLLTALFWPQEGNVNPYEDLWIGLYYDYVSELIQTLKERVLQFCL